ncbi:MAG: glycosyltransferase, partial [Flavobacteriales bacterium]
MIHAPLVSIIIPTFNRAHLIGETLDSVLGQTYTNWECIVVDDGSTDTTNEVMQEYLQKDARFKYHHRPKEHLSGGNGARNYGFKLSDGEYIQWFDDDDVMLNDKIQAEIEAFQRYNVDFVIGSGYSVDENLQNRKPKELNVGKNLYESYTLWESEIFLPSVTFKKMFLNKYELFNEKLTRGQENEFFSRLFFYTYKNNNFYILNKFLYLYRQHVHNKRNIQRKEYINSYLKSFVFVSLANFKRGIKINNKRVLNFHFKNIVYYFFEALSNNDKETCYYILKKTLPKLLRV